MIAALTFHVTKVLAGKTKALPKNSALDENFPHPSLAVAKFENNSIKK